MQGKVSKSSKKNLQDVYSWSDQSAINVKTNQRCKSEVEACKPTAVTTYSIAMSRSCSKAFFALWQLQLQGCRYCVCHRKEEGCLLQLLLHLFTAWNSGVLWLSTGRAQSLWPSFKHSGNIESSRDCSVRSYTDLSRNWPSTLVAREGCWMFDWHKFCNFHTTGTKHVTTSL